MLIYCLQYSAGEAVHERTPNVTSQCFNLISSEMEILNYAVSGLKNTYVQWSLKNLNNVFVITFY